MKVAVLCCALLMLLSSLPLPASTLLFDGFETYNRGALDANYPSGTNAAPNGGPGNPWWGYEPPDMVVVGMETNKVTGVVTNIVTPHGGTNMIRGKNTGSPDLDLEFYNVAYRLNGGKAYSGNVSLDWWFFDPVGAKTNTNAAPQYQDFGSLAYWIPNVTNMDYATNDLGLVNLDFITTQLSLGASTSQITGYKSTNYQAQIYPNSSTNAYDQANGWFNLPVVRSNGWHHAMIVVGTNATNGTAPVSFYIDNLTNAVLTNTVALTNGLNSIVLQAEYGNLTGYYDDLTFTGPAQAVLSITVTGTNAIVTWPVTNWILQSSTNLVSGSFTNISNAVSPYTNSLTGPARFFRLLQ
jgi:hypothetical protein